MACDTVLKPNQTLAQRRDEVRESAKMIDKLLAARKIQVKVGPQGAVTFTGLTAADRNGMTDACIYRMLTRTGSAATRMKLAALPVSRQALHQGIHSHDGGNTWSSH
jgi:hypothetical protein